MSTTRGNPASTGLTYHEPMSEAPVAPRPLAGQLWRFATIGTISTVIHLGLFWVFTRSWGHDQIANAVALVIATLVNTGLNRAWTFRVRGPNRLARHHAQGLFVFAVTWLASAAALQAVAWWWPQAGDGARTGVVLVANALSTALRFGAMRWWMFTEPAARHEAVS